MSHTDESMSARPSKVCNPGTHEMLSMPQCHHGVTPLSPFLRLLPYKIQTLIRGFKAGGYVLFLALTVSQRLSGG